MRDEGIDRRSWASYAEKKARRKRRVTMERVLEVALWAMVVLSMATMAVE
jgi:hypothetical protein